MSLDVHIEEVRKLKGQHDNLDIINKIIMDSSDGQNIELQNTSISIINLRNPIYFILPSINSEEGILVEVEHNLLAELIGQDKLDVLLENFNDKLNSVLIFQGTFLREITISGSVTKIIDPITLEKDINVIRANNLGGSMSNDWKRGYLLFEGDDKSYLQINEGLRERIAKGLQSYVHTNIFGFLTQEIYDQFIGNKEKLYAMNDPGASHQLINLCGNNYQVMLRTYADVPDLEQNINFRPNTSIEEGLQKFIV